MVSQDAASEIKVSDVCDHVSYTLVEPVQHDGRVHHPLGAGSYVYKDPQGLLQSILRYTHTHPNTTGKILRHHAHPVTPGPLTMEDDNKIKCHHAPTVTAVPLAALEQPCALSLCDSKGTNKPCVTGSGRGLSSRALFIHVGAQPNNSPHAGTMTVFTTAFVLGRELQKYHEQLVAQSNIDEHLSVCVQLDIVDTAPADQVTKGGVKYQRSQRGTQKMLAHLPDYFALCKDLHAFVGEDTVAYRIEYQETLMRLPGVPEMLRRIIAARADVGPEIAPETGCLALRAACPHTDASGAVCGWADKHGVRSSYAATPGRTAVTFRCWDPAHAPYTRVLEDPADAVALEFNTPLRNLLRELVYADDTLRSHEGGGPERYHMRVTGLDYAGTYQEQTLWRQFIRLTQGTPQAQLNPTILYSPQIVDWSGAKLSKSLYVAPGAYTYLRDSGMGFLLSLKDMVAADKDPRVLFREVEGWVMDPKKLFRLAYSLEYLRMVFEKAEQEGGGADGHGSCGKGGGEEDHKQGNNGDEHVKNGEGQWEEGQAAEGVDEGNEGDNRGNEQLAD